MIKFLILIITISMFMVSCSKVRESAGVNRKVIDEFKIVENPPLQLPPDFNLLPPEQLSENKIETIEAELAQEILFGLDEEDENNEFNLSTMENILNQADASSVDESIRDEIDEDFAQEKKINSKAWSTEAEILNSVQESERLRNNLLSDSDDQQSVPKSTIKIDNKKKKRFFFF